MDLLGIYLRDWKARNHTTRDSQVCQKSVLLHRFMSLSYTRSKVSPTLVKLGFGRLLISRLLKPFRMMIKILSRITNFLSGSSESLDSINVF